MRFEGVFQGDAVVHRLDNRIGKVGEVFKDLLRLGAKVPHGYWNYYDEFVFDWTPYLPLGTFVYLLVGDDVYWEALLTDERQFRGSGTAFPPEVLSTIRGEKQRDETIFRLKQMIKRSGTNAVVD